MNKLLGLLVTAFGLSVLYLVGFKCYRWPEFLQELVNFTHVPFGKVQPGAPVNPAPCPPWNPFGAQSGK